MLHADPQPSPCKDGKDPSQHKNNLEPLLVVLDIDETLVHSNWGEGAFGDFTLGEGGFLKVQKRPGVDKFLQWLNRPDIRVAIYTAGDNEYATSVVARLDPHGAVVKQQLSRDDCVSSPIQGVFCKDLSKFGPNLERVVLVDNCPMSFYLQPKNGILVNDWLGTDPEDNELQRVQEVLQGLLDVDNVQEALNDEFPIQEMVQCFIDNYPKREVLSYAPDALPVETNDHAFCCPCWGPILPAQHLLHPVDAVTAERLQSL